MQNTLELQWIISGNRMWGWLKNFGKKNSLEIGIGLKHTDFSMLRAFPLAVGTRGQGLLGTKNTSARGLSLQANYGSDSFQTFNEKYST